MGGHDSGWWGGTPGRAARRRQVEECVLLLPITDLRPWLMASGFEHPVVLSASWCGDRLWFEPVDLTPRCQRERPRKQDDWCKYVDVEPHPWPIYGTRWFFRCSCNRRCDCLYIVRRGSPILCRICHDLSYRSAQTYDIAVRRGRFPLRIHRLAGVPPPPGSYKVRKRAAVSGRRATQADP